jgi:hypothetical protein
VTITDTGTLTLDIPAEQISWGQMVLASAEHAARAGHWPEEGGKPVADAMEQLWFHLGIADAIGRDQINPAAEYPELADEPWAKHLAMARAAEEVAECAEELIRLFPAAAMR